MFSSSTGRSYLISNLETAPIEADDYWTEWFTTTLATNGGAKEIRKPTLKKTAHPLLEDGGFEWLRIEITPVGVDADRVLSGIGKRNSHGAYYIRGVLLPDGWPTLPAEYLCRFRPAWIDDASGQYV
jgi:hypothetical protein